MERKVGTVSRGIRCPIIREGDDLAQIVVDSVLDAAKSEGFALRDRDVVAVTESVVARAQGNYAHIDAIAQDVKEKLGGETVGVIFPILSRNRFAVCLRGIAKGAKKIVLMLSYPSDEVGNELVSLDQLDAAGVNPYSDVLTEEKYRDLFGENRHPFTMVDYVQYYGDLIRECGAEAEIIFANNPRVILNYTKNVLTCDIHSRVRTKRILRENGAECVCGLDDILTSSIDGSGYNEKFGLLGSNKSTEDKIKLFPKDCTDLVLDVQKRFLDATGKHIEVMVYGDGAFKDPVGKIWDHILQTAQDTDRDILHAVPELIEGHKEHHIGRQADHLLVVGEEVRNGVAEEDKDQRSDDTPPQDKVVGGLRGELQLLEILRTVAV